MSQSDESNFMPLPKPYWTDGERIPDQKQQHAANGAQRFPVRQAPEAQSSIAESAEVRFMPPRAYTVTNEVADLNVMIQRVLELEGDVARSAEGSAERLAAERALISSRSNLLIQARSTESDLASKVAALQGPGANIGERDRFEAELRSVRDLLRVLEAQEQPSKDKQQPRKRATNAMATNVTNSAVLEKALGILSGWKGGVVE